MVSHHQLVYIYPVRDGFDHFYAEWWDEQRLLDRENGQYFGIWWCRKQFWEKTVSDEWQFRGRVFHDPQLNWYVWAGDRRPYGAFNGKDYKGKGKGKGEDYKGKDNGKDGRAKGFVLSGKDAREKGFGKDGTKGTPKSGKGSPKGYNGTKGVKGVREFCAYNPFNE